MAGAAAGAVVRVEPGVLLPALPGPEVPGRPDEGEGVVEEGGLGRVKIVSCERRGRFPGFLVWRLDDPPGFAADGAGADGCPGVGRRKASYEPGRVLWCQ